MHMCQSSYTHSRSLSPSLSHTLPLSPSGWDDVFDDPKMGWSRWAHSFHAFSLNSGLFYLLANNRTIGLMDRITDRLNKEQAWDQVTGLLGERGQERGEISREAKGWKEEGHAEETGNEVPLLQLCLLPDAFPLLSPLFISLLQAVFNEEVWKPSSRDYKRAGVSLRIMDIYLFVNSKTLFRTMR
jgi:hypothetical protein